MYYTPSILPYGHNTLNQSNPYNYATMRNIGSNDLAQAGYQNIAKMFSLLGNNRMAQAGHHNYATLASRFGHSQAAQSGLYNNLNLINSGHATQSGHHNHAMLQALMPYVQQMLSQNGGGHVTANTGYGSNQTINGQNGALHALINLLGRDGQVNVNGSNQFRDVLNVPASNGYNAGNNFINFNGGTDQDIARLAANYQFQRAHHGSLYFKDAHGNIVKVGNEDKVYLGNQLFQQPMYPQPYHNHNHHYHNHGYHM